MANVVLPSANQVIRQFADYPDVDMRFADKAAFVTAITSATSRIPDGWLSYCLLEKKWFQADKAVGAAKEIAGGFEPIAANEAGVDHPALDTARDAIIYLLSRLNQEPQPQAPTNPVTNDDADTFTFTFNTNINQPAAPTAVGQDDTNDTFTFNI